MKTKTSLTRNSINRSLLRNCFFLIGLIVAWFAPSPQARGTCQQGCLTNDNTVLGDDAFLNNANGTFNTAIGGNALLSNRSGHANTALGFEALQNNTSGDSN